MYVHILGVTVQVSLMSLELLDHDLAKGAYSGRRRIDNVYLHATYVHILGGTVQVGRNLPDHGLAKGAYSGRRRGL